MFNVLFSHAFEIYPHTKVSQGNLKSMETMIMMESHWASNFGSKENHENLQKHETSWYWKAWLTVFLNFGFPIKKYSSLPGRPGRCRPLAPTFCPDFWNLFLGPVPRNKIIMLPIFIFVVSIIVFLWKVLFASKAEPFRRACRKPDPVPCFRWDRAWRLLGPPERPYPEANI